jgi:hypothetical protein
LVLGLEVRALLLLGRLSTTLAMPPIIFAFIIFQITSRWATILFMLPA